MKNGTPNPIWWGFFFFFFFKSTDFIYCFVHNTCCGGCLMRLLLIRLNGFLLPCPVGIWQGAKILAHRYSCWSTYRYRSITLHFYASHLCTSYCLCLHCGTNLFVIPSFHVTDYLQWSTEFITYKCELSSFSPQSFVPEDWGEILLFPTYLLLIECLVVSF